MADGCSLKDEVTERAVVWPIAEASRNNCHDLATWCCLCHGQRDKSRIQIHRLNANGTQGQPVSRIAVDLLVGRIKNRMSVINGGLRK